MLNELRKIADWLDKKGLVKEADLLDAVLEKVARDPFGPQWRKDLWEEDPLHPDAHPNPEAYLASVQRGDAQHGQPANPVWQKNYKEEYTLFEEDGEKLHNELVNNSNVSTGESGTSYIYTFPNGISVEIKRVPSSSLGTAPIPADDFGQVHARVNLLMNANFGNATDGGSQGYDSFKDELFADTKPNPGLGGFSTAIQLGNGFYLSAIDGRARSKEDFLNKDYLEVAIVSPGGLIGYQDFKDAGFPWAQHYRSDQVAWIEIDEIAKITEWLKKNVDKLPRNPKPFSFNWDDDDED